MNRLHRTYRFVRSVPLPQLGENHVEVWDADRNKKYRLKHQVRHSPTGLEWGYGGIGPADTALSILTDLVGKEIALRWYQQFKFSFIAQVAREGTPMLTSDQICDWLESLMELDLDEDLKTLK